MRKGEGDLGEEGSSKGVKTFCVSLKIIFKIKTKTTVLSFGLFVCFLLFNFQK